MSGAAERVSSSCLDVHTHPSWFVFVVDQKFWERNRCVRAGGYSKLKMRKESLVRTEQGRGGTGMDGTRAGNEVGTYGRVSVMWCVGVGGRVQGRGTSPPPWGRIWKLGSGK